MADQLFTPAAGPQTDTISYEDFVKWKNRIQSEVPEKEKQAGYISALRDIVDADVPTEALADILKPVYNEESQKPRGRPDVMEAEKMGTDPSFRMSPAMQEPDKTGLSLTSPDDPLSPEKLMATPKSFGPQDLLRPGGPEEDQTLNIEGPFSYENLMKPAFQYGPDKLARPADQLGDVVIPGEPLKSEEEIDKKDLFSQLPQDWTKYVGLGALALFPAIVARMTGGDKETMMRAYAGGGKGLEEFGKQWLQSKRVKPDVVDIGGIPHQIMYDKEGNPVLTPIPGAKKAAEAAKAADIAGKKEIIEAEGGQRIKLAELQGEIDEKLANLKGKSDIDKAQYAGQLEREIKELEIEAEKLENEAKRAAQDKDAEREAELKRQAEQNRLQIESKKAENDFLRNNDENAYRKDMLRIREKEVDALNKLRTAQADKAKADAAKPPKPAPPPKLSKLQEREESIRAQLPPGIDLAPGQVPSEKDVEDIKNGFERRQGITNSLNELSNLVKKHGTQVMPGDVRSKMESLVKGIQLEMKEMVNLGVLNGPDVEFLGKIIGDPTSIGEAVKSAMTQDQGASLLTKYNQLRKSLDEKMSSKIFNRGFLNNRIQLNRQMNQNDLDNLKLNGVIELPNGKVIKRIGNTGDDEKDFSFSK